MTTQPYKKVVTWIILFCLTFIFGNSLAFSDDRSFHWADRFFSHKNHFKFVGYWEGIDPLDGDISNLSITRETGHSSHRANAHSQAKDVYRIVSASQGFVLFCDVEPGFSKGKAVRQGNKLVSDDRVIVCVGDELITEHQSPVEIISDNRNDAVILTFPEADRSPIVFHRLSK